MSAIELHHRPALAARVRLRLDPVTGAPTLLYPEGLIELNPTAHEILARCDGGTSIEEIIASLAGEYDASEQQVRADVMECLHELHQRNLVMLAP